MKIEELEAVLSRATPGPWRIDDDPPTVDYGIIAGDPADPVTVAEASWDYTRAKGDQSPDAAAIVALRNHAEALIGVVKKARAYAAATDGYFDGLGIGDAVVLAGNELDEALQALEAV